MGLGILFKYLWQQYKTHMEFLSIQGIFGITGLSYAHKLIEFWAIILNIL
jgi:hypothetical protein